MRQRATHTFPEGTIVTHSFLGSTYRVVESRPFSTDVVTNDKDEVDISFLTVDLLPTD